MSPISQCGRQSAIMLLSLRFSMATVCADMTSQRKKLKKNGDEFVVVFPSMTFSRLARAVDSGSDKHLKLNHVDVA